MRINIQVIGRKGLEQHLGEGCSVEGARIGTESKGMISYGDEGAAGKLCLDKRKQQFYVSLTFDPSRRFYIFHCDIVSLWEGKHMVEHCYLEGLKT